MNSDSLQIHTLESKVQLLRGKMDSINQLLTNQALQYEVNKQVDIVDKIDGLYNNAMSDILWIVGGIITFVGILTPLLIQYLQNRYYEQRLETIFQESKEELDDIVEELQSVLKKHSEEVHSKLINQEKLTLGHFFMSLAVTQRNVQNHIAAFQGFLVAAIHYSWAGSYVRENECIGFMEEHLPFIDESGWKQIEEDFLSDRGNSPTFHINQLLISQSDINQVDPRRYNRILEAIKSAGGK